jgi:hypothetical protein
MVMNKIKQTSASPIRAGFSEINIRFLVLGFLGLILSLTPLFGLLAAILVSIVFGVFAIVKLKESQNNAEYCFDHRLSMDRLYNYGYGVKNILRVQKLYYKAYPENRPAKQVIAKKQVTVRTAKNIDSKQVKYNNLNLAISR